MVSISISFKVKVANAKTNTQGLNAEALMLIKALVQKPILKALMQRSLLKALLRKPDFLISDATNTNTLKTINNQSPQLHVKEILMAKCAFKEIGMDTTTLDMTLS